jgi:hypothetical protein
MPVTARSEVARLLELQVRIPRGGMDICLGSVVCCQVSSVRRADHSSRGALLSVAYLNVIVNSR